MIVIMALPKGIPCGEEFYKNTIIRRLKCIGLIILVDCFQNFHHHPIHLSRFYLVKNMNLIDYNGTKTTKSSIPEYRVWQQIHQRCKNKNNKTYSRYGGRGITVCDRWMVFENFIEDMGCRPIGGEKMSIERVNVHGNYEPSNCVWATWTEQHRNTTRSRFIEFNGEKKPMVAWAEFFGITRNCLFDRIKRHGEKKAIEISFNKNLHKEFQE